MADERNEKEAVLDDLLDELDELLKNPELVASLTARGINSSLAILIADGFRAYVRGNKAQAAEDLDTAAEEIASRLAMSSGSSGQLLS